MAAPFPSLVIRADAVEPRGTFAESLATYLRPDRSTVERIGRALSDHQIGVVAHFYMDAELQGVLAACGEPHVLIADSLAMADHAVTMARAGAHSIVVLGVDFMSGNVRATLDATGFSDVPVYRAAREPIGCSLAEAAETKQYADYLTRAAATPRSLHVIYINTSLGVKARAEATLPTITCTSSNVVHSVLQAAAQIPDLNIWFGPDTYMGRNLRELLGSLASLDAAAIRAVHPAHDAHSITATRERFHFFEQGACVVHQLFGAQVAERVAREYGDAFLTAHLEVPGELFRMALTAQALGRGVVGSTSSILDFIRRNVASSSADARLRFVLGTESGMVTSIVRAVQREQNAAITRGARAAEVELIFPVAAEAITPTSEAELAIVPGPRDGEGCSVAGGCATCPFMKMNSLDAVLSLVEKIGAGASRELAPWEAARHAETLAGDTRSVAELATIPILRMRELQRTGTLPEALVTDIRTRTPAGARG